MALSLPSSPAPARPAEDSSPAPLETKSLRPEQLAAGAVAEAVGGGAGSAGAAMQALKAQALEQLPGLAAEPRQQAARPVLTALDGVEAVSPPLIIMTAMPAMTTSSSTASPM